MYNLRLGTISDLSDTKRLVDSFYKQSIYKSLTYDDTRVSDTLRDTLSSSNDLKIVILGTKDEIPIGLVAGQVAPAPFSTQLVGLEQAWFVEEEHRNSKIGLELLSAFEEWCRLVGCDFIQLSSLGASQSIADTIYERRGYSLVEKAYLKQIGD